MSELMNEHVNVSIFLNFYVHVVKSIFRWGFFPHGKHYRSVIYYYYHYSKPPTQLACSDEQDATWVKGHSRHWLISMCMEMSYEAFHIWVIGDVELSTYKQLVCVKLKSFYILIIQFFTFF